MAVNASIWVDVSKMKMEDKEESNVHGPINIERLLAKPLSSAISTMYQVFPKLASQLLDVIDWFWEKKYRLPKL